MSTRPVDSARLTLGTLALARPDRVVRLAGGAPHVTDRRAVRVLGARYLLQAGGGFLVDRPWVSGADAAVDLVHAVSMVGLAAGAPRHRRLALTSAAVAVGFAVADLLESRRRRER